MPRETIIPSVSVEVVKEVVPPSPAATGIVAILGSTEKGTPNKPTRIDRFSTFKEGFGAASVYSMPEAKHALQNGAKELVIVKLENGSRASAEFNSVVGNPALRLTARAEGNWGREIRAQILDGRVENTHRVDLYFRSDEPVESFDNLSMQPAHERYLVRMINSQSELVTAEDLTGTLPAVMANRQSLQNGLDGIQSSIILTGTAGGAANTSMITVRAINFGPDGDSIHITVEPGTSVGNNISVADPSTTEIYEDIELDPTTAGKYILSELNSSGLVRAELHADYPSYTDGDVLDNADQPLVGGQEREPAVLPTPLQDTAGNDLISVTGRDPGDGSGGNGIYVRVDAGSSDEVVTLKVWDAGTAAGDPENEIYADVHVDPGSPDYIVTRVNSSSTRIELAYLAEAETLAAISEPQNLGTDGGNPDLDAFETGLASLEKEPDVDIVVPSVQYPSPEHFSTADFNYSQNVFAAVDSHCKRMSEAANNRVGFGGVSRMESLSTSTERTTTVGSDRFVIVAPHGVVGAVAGLVGSLTYYYSPTFKAITGFTSLERDFSPTDLRTLLRANVVPLDAKKGLGIVVIRGLTTDGDQISVRRVADYAVRNVKSIAERFIGNLNTQEGRDALKQKVVEFLQQMEKDSAIVPSTDGTDPAFKIDVYSTQRDFALGIVRVDIAVRPVRAMDFIYATILVQV